MNIVYELVAKLDQATAIKTGTLLEIWGYSRLSLKKPIDYLVLEKDKDTGKQIDMITAKFLIERFKSADRLPRKFAYIRPENED